MLEIPQIRVLPDGSLCLFQSALAERVVCLSIGTVALACFGVMTLENLPLNAADVMVFVVTLGFLFRALMFASTEARFEPRIQTVFYCRNQWGYKRKREFKFAEIESLRRIECFQTGEMGLRVRFSLRVGGKELPLCPDALSTEQADQLEARLRDLLPSCPIEVGPKPEREIEQVLLSEGAHRLWVEGALERSPDGTLRVQRSATFDRLGSILIGSAFFAYSMFRFEIDSAKGVGLVLVALACVLGSLTFHSFEFRFDPHKRHVVLIEEVFGLQKERIFEFSSIHAIRRKSWTTNEGDAPPRERFHLFLQIGDEEFNISPKELSRAQADELQTVVEDALGSSLPLLISNTNN